MRFLLINLIIFPLLWTSVLASDFDMNESFNGLKFGLVGSGEVDHPGLSVERQSGFIGGLFFDFPFGSRFHYGISADLMAMPWVDIDPGFDLSQTEYLLDLGINLKMNLGAEQSDILFRPGVGIGFGAMGKMERFALAGSSYLTLKAFAEIAYATPSELVLLFDGGVWYAPSGGDEVRDVHIGPLVFLRAGIMF